MRYPMHTEPAFTAPPLQNTYDALTVSALRTTREAIARWSGKSLPTAALSRNSTRVSPQARWVADTQRHLAAFFEDGGFAQFEGATAPLPASLRPTLYVINPAETVPACME